jgi:hypothetical protein
VLRRRRDGSDRQLYAELECSVLALHNYRVGSIIFLHMTCARTRNTDHEYSIERYNVPVSNDSDLLSHGTECRIYKRNESIIEDRVLTTLAPMIQQARIDLVARAIHGYFEPNI